MKRKIAPDVAQRIRQGIEALGEPPPQDITPQEMLKELAPLLKQKREMGWADSDLTNELSKLGFEVAETTVRKYLIAESKKADTRRRSKKRTAGKNQLTPQPAASVTLLAQPTHTSTTTVSTTESAPKAPKATQPVQQHGGFNEDV